MILLTLDGMFGEEKYRKEGGGGIIQTNCRIKRGWVTHVLGRMAKTLSLSYHREI